MIQLPCSIQPSPARAAFEKGQKSTTREPKLASHHLCGIGITTTVVVLLLLFLHGLGFFFSSCQQPTHIRNIQVCLVLHHDHDVPRSRGDSVDVDVILDARVADVLFSFCFFLLWKMAEKEGDEGFLFFSFAVAEFFGGGFGVDSLLPAVERLRALAML